MFRALLIWFTIYLAFTPPSLCPCWLIAEVRTVHPHFGRAPREPHDHAYLLEMFQSQPAAILQPLLPHVGEFIAQWLDASLWRARDNYRLTPLGWRARPPTPPPREAAS